VNKTETFCSCYTSSPCHATVISRLNAFRVVVSREGIHKPDAIHQKNIIYVIRPDSKDESIISVILLSPEFHIILILSCNIASCRCV